MNLLEQGYNVDVVYLDFAKAFDKVDHNILLHKLKHLNINGKTLQWIKSFLEGRLQRVIVNGQLSKPHPVVSGVPQGSVLGPLLFLVLIGDIDEHVQHSIVASFADDTRVTKGIKTIEDAVDLQNDLFHIYGWSERNNSSFNSVKFELMRYGSNMSLKESTNYVSPEWQLIEAKGAVKDLGIMLEDNLAFKQHIDNITESAKRMSAWVFRTFNTREQLPLMTLYKSLVRPLVEYSSALWSPISKADINKLEAIQKSFVRKIRGVSREYETALKQLNLYSLEQRRDRYRIIQIWKMLENLAPNHSSTNDCILRLQTDINHRRGRTIENHNLARTPSHLLKAREQSIKFSGVQLFNNLPKSIRNTTMTSVDTFKRLLDRHIRKQLLILSSSEQPSSNARPPATVFEDALTPPLRQRGIEQFTCALPNVTVAGESFEQGSGPQALQPTTQTL